MTKPKETYKPANLSESLIITVRFSETDPLGIVWHGNYIKYFEDGREAFGRKYGISYLNVEREGYHFGEWEGLYFAEIASRYPDLWQSWLHDWAHTRIPGGDDFTAFAQRLLDFCDEILNEYSGRNLAVVSHGGCIRAILSHYLSVDRKSVV